MQSNVSCHVTEIAGGRHGIASLSSIRVIASYGKGEPIYSELDSPDHWYCVTSGAARKYTVLSDGRRRIIDFMFPGDYFGFPDRHRQYFAADALSDETIVAHYPRRGIEAAADRDPRLGRELREIVLDAISRSHARLLILGRVRSVEKVASFLAEMAERCLNRRERTVVLPMSRYDIADYLALSVETVSRALTRLRHERAIRFVDKHRISILDGDLLDGRVIDEHEPEKIARTGETLTTVNAGRDGKP
jgi:CRP-like cAMP-binding protein